MELSGLLRSRILIPRSIIVGPINKFVLQHVLVNHKRYILHSVTNWRKQEHPADKNEP